MKFVASSRVRLFGALLLAVTLVVAAALTATSRAGSVRTSVVITFSPHVLTVGQQVGQQGFLSIKFVNAGPSTVNHVFERVTDTSGNPLPLPKRRGRRVPIRLRDDHESCCHCRDAETGSCRRTFA